MARYVKPSCTMYIRLRPQQPKCTQIYGTNFYNVHIGGRAGVQGERGRGRPPRLLAHGGVDQLQGPRQPLHLNRLCRDFSQVHKS